MTEGTPHQENLWSGETSCQVSMVEVRINHKMQISCRIFTVASPFHSRDIFRGIYLLNDSRWTRCKVASLLTQLPCRACVLWPVLWWHPGGACFLFYYTDSISHLLAADTVAHGFVSMEMAMGWQWFKLGLCDVVLCDPVLVLQQIIGYRFSSSIKTP